MLFNKLPETFKIVVPDPLWLTASVPDMTDEKI